MTSPVRDHITLVLPPACPCIRIVDIQGNPHGKVVVGQVTTPKDWEAELGAARAAKTAVKWLGGALDTWERESRPEGDGSTDQTRRAAWAAGLEAGMRGEYAQLKGVPNAPRLPPTWTGKGGRAHANGWRLGDAMRRAVKIANNADSFPSK